MSGTSTPRGRAFWGVLVTVVVLSACGGQPGPAPTGSTPEPAPPSTTTSIPSTATSTATPAPTSTASSVEPTPPTTSPAPTTTTRPSSYANLPIYFVGRSSGSWSLFREFRTVPAIDGRISSAVSAMTRLRPLDPDYTNPWRPASRVWVTQRGSTLAVDLSADAFANPNVGSELASRAVQQLIYTATAAAFVAGHSATSVVITVDGQPADVWGVIRVGTPMTRAAKVDVQAQAWVTSPQEGDVVRAGAVTFTGYGTSFEATFHWRVSRADASTVAEGTVMGGSMGEFGAFSWTVRLAPGTYVVRLATDDPSGGAGPGPAVDTKRFTVR